MNRFKDKNGYVRLAVGDHPAFISGKTKREISESWGLRVKS